MSVLNKVSHYKKKIETNKEHTETLIHYINKLDKLPITVWHLEKTGIGKTINELRKRFDGGVSNAAKALVWKWKRVVSTEKDAEEQAKKEKGLNDLNCVSECDTLHQSTEGKGKVHSPSESISQVFPINQSSPKTERQKGGHHNRSRRDEPKHNNKDKEVDREFGIKTDDINIEKREVNNKQEQKKTLSSGLSSKHSHCSKLSQNETKYLKSKHCCKERGQKRKTGFNGGSTEKITKQPKAAQKMARKEYNIDYFAEALRKGDAIGNKRSSSTTTSVMNNSDSNISPGTKTTSSPLNSVRDTVPVKPNLWLADAKLKPLHVEIDLPFMSPNSNPMTHLSLKEENTALKYASEQAPLFKQPRQRMKVYSGVKTGQPVPTLYELSIHVLKEHIDALKYTGGVPYYILKPILQQATPEQLFRVEYYNTYLIEDTNELWEFHCQKEFRFGQLQPMETAREMYLRCLNERQEKLKAVTCKIQQSLTKQFTRQTKLAHVTSNPKLPKNVAREQAKHGTGGENSQSSVTSTSRDTFGFLKKSRANPRLAPLMRKSIKLANTFKGYKKTPGLSGT